MEPLKFVLSLMEAVAFLVIMVIVAIKLSKVNRPKPPCDTCDHLKHKEKKWNKKYFRYDCDKQDDGFNVPPQYCRDYVERKSGGQDDV